MIRILTCVSLLATTMLLGCASPERTVAGRLESTLTRTFVLTGARGPREGAGVPGRIDHFAYDPATHRLFVAALENGSLEVLDLDTGERVKSIGGLSQPQGIAVVPTAGCVAVACGGDGLVRVYDTRTLEEKTSVQVGKGADNVRYDARANTVYVSHGNTEGGALAVLDARTWEKLREIPFDSRPESFQLEPAGTRVFANLPEGIRATKDGVVAAADRHSGEITARIQLEDRTRNFPMAFDAAHERLFIACRRPARLIAIDARRFEVVAEAVCTDDSDDLFYDAKTNRVLVIGGGFRPDMQETADGQGDPPDETGAIDVFSVGEYGELNRIASIRTAPHARTGFFVPDRRAIYVAVPLHEGRDPEIREYRVAD